MATEHLSGCKPARNRRDMAETFLSALDSGAKSFCFQTFDDVKGRKDPRLSRTLHGSLDTLWSGLDAVNSTGAGVFVTVNVIRYREKRTIQNLAAIRAIWQDDDAGFTGEYPVVPSLVTLTSAGKFHRIWVTEGLTPEQHQAVMWRMVVDYGCDKGARDLVRVLRLPGFYHVKDPARPQLVEIVDATGATYSAEEIMQAFPPLWPEPVSVACSIAPRVRFDTASSDKATHRLLAALACIPADGRAEWLKVGQALKHELGEAGRGLWDRWAQQSEKYARRDQSKVCASFKREQGACVTISSLFYMARQHGFRG